MKNFKKLSMLLALLMVTVLTLSACSLIGGGSDEVSVDAAEELLDDGEISEAIDMLEEIVSDDEEDYEAWKLLVEAYIEDEEFEDAADALEAMGEVIADNYDADDDDIADAMEDYADLAEEIMGEDEDIEIADIMDLIDAGDRDVAEDDGDEDGDNEEDDGTLHAEGLEKPEDHPEVATEEKPEDKPSGKPEEEAEGNKIELTTGSRPTGLIGIGAGAMETSGSDNTDDDSTDATNNNTNNNSSSGNSSSASSDNNVSDVAESNDDVYFMGEVAPGDVIETYLYAGTYDIYEFVPSSSGSYAIGTIGSLDTYGEIFDYDIIFYDYNDDDGDEFNFMLSVYLDAGVPYYIAVSGFDETDEGTYSLYVIEDEGEEGTDVYDMGPLYVDDEYSTNLVANTVDAYTFTPASSGYYYIGTTGNVDTYGEIYDRNFDYYNYDDDGGEGMNFLLEVYLDGGVRYNIDVTGYDATVQGNYTIYIIDGTSSIGTDAYNMGPLYLGDVFETFIVAGAVDQYQFTPTYGGYYTIGTTGYTDTYGEVYDASLYFYDYDDDGGEGVNFMISGYFDGGVTYYIDVAGYSDETSGDYAIYVIETGSSGAYTGNEIFDMGALYVGDNFGSYLYPNTTDIYSFTPGWTGYYYIGTTGYLDTYGEIYDASYYYYDYDDDGGDGSNFMIYAYLESGVTYFIDVSAYYADDEGNYNIYISEVSGTTGSTGSTGGEVYDMGALYVGDEFSTYLYPDSVDIYTFTPGWSGYYYIGTSSYVDTYGLMYDASYNFYDTSDDDGGNSDFLFYSYLDGGVTYYIEVSGYSSYDEGDYTIFVMEDSGDGGTGINNSGDVYDMGALYEGDYSETYLLADTIDMYSFMPTHSGYYYIGTVSDIDTYGVMYDDNFDFYDTSDDDGGNSDFMFYAYLEYGVRYYIEVSGYDSYTEGSYAIYVYPE